MAHLDIDVAVRWTDLDAYGHVNNAAMVRLLEEGRIAAFWQPTAEEIALGPPTHRPRSAPPVWVRRSAPWWHPSASSTSRHSGTAAKG